MLMQYMHVCYMTSNMRLLIIIYFQKKKQSWSSVVKLSANINNTHCMQCECVGLSEVWWYWYPRANHINHLEYRYSRVQAQVYQ